MVVSGRALPVQAMCQLRSWVKQEQVSFSAYGWDLAILLISYQRVTSPRGGFSCRREWRARIHSPALTLLSGVGLLRGKRHLMTHSWFCFSLLGTGPWFG